MANENYNQFIERLAQDPTKLAFRELEEPAVVEFLLLALQDERNEVRLDAVLFFERAGEFLVKQARYNRTDHTAAVEQALERAKDLLLARLQDDNRDVREVAAAAFRHIRDERVFPALLQALQKRQIEPDNSEAVIALAINGGSEALSYLEGLAKSREYELRVVAATALGEIQASSSLGLLEDLLDDEQDIVRATAAEKLANFGGDEQALQILINRFRFEEVSLVRFRILDSFAAFPDKPETIPYLIEGLTDEDSELADAAISSLKQQNFELVLQNLLPLLSQDEDDEEAEIVQSRVILALRELGNPSAIPVLETIVATNSDPLNVADAQEAIRILQKG